MGVYRLHVAVEEVAAANACLRVFLKVPEQYGYGIVDKQGVRIEQKQVVATGNNGAGIVGAPESQVLAKLNQTQALVGAQGD